MALDFFSSDLLPMTIVFIFTGIDMCRVSMDFVMSETFSRLVVLRIVAMVMFIWRPKTIRNMGQDVRI